MCSCTVLCTTARGKSFHRQGASARRRRARLRLREKSLVVRDRATYPRRQWLSYNNYSSAIPKEEDAGGTGGEQTRIRAVQRNTRPYTVREARTHILASSALRRIRPLLRVASRPSPFPHSPYFFVLSADHVQYHSAASLVPRSPFRGLAAWFLGTRTIVEASRPRRPSVALARRATACTHHHAATVRTIDTHVQS